MGRAGAVSPLSVRRDGRGLRRRGRSGRPEAADEQIRDHRARDVLGHALRPQLAQMIIVVRHQMDLGAGLGDEFHRVVALDVEDLLVGGDLVERAFDREIVLVARETCRVLQPDERDIDVVGLQPIDRGFDDLGELFRIDAGERVVGAELPEDEVGLVRRHLAADALRRGRRHFASGASIDDVDVDALEGELENVLDLNRVALDPGVVAEALGRGGADREDFERPMAAERLGEMRQRRVRGDVARGCLARRAELWRNGRRSRVFRDAPRAPQPEAQDGEACEDETAGDGKAAAVAGTTLDRVRHSSTHAIDAMIETPTINNITSVTTEPPYIKRTI